MAASAAALPDRDGDFSSMCENTPVGGIFNGWRELGRRGTCAPFWFLGSMIKVKSLISNECYSRNFMKSEIEYNPKIMLGKPVIKGTRITVELILRKLA